MTRAADDFAAIRARMRELDGSAQPPATYAGGWELPMWTINGPIPVYTGPTIDFLSVDFAPHADAEWTAKKS